MRTLSNFARALLLAACVLAALPAYAGRSCEAKKPTVQSIERGLALAQRTQAELDASGQRVVVLARAGQDLTKYGVHYSHLGFAYRQPDGNGGHVWRVLHKLNHCGTNAAAIYRQGLGDFFLDDLWRYEAAYSALAPQLQDRLLALLQDDARSTAMNHQPYSIVSYAWGLKYQQSNQWAIETIAAAMAPSIRAREPAQAWLRAQGYDPAVLTLGPLTRLGARVGAANVAFDDHPAAKRFSDRIETVTADSVFEWLQRSGLGGRTVRVGLR